MKTRPWITPSLAILLLAMVSAAWATPPTENDDIVLSNVAGATLTYASTSTNIPLHPANSIEYTFSGPVFPCSDTVDTTFATFTFDWADYIHGTTSAGTVSASISFGDSGGLTLVSSPTPVNVPISGTQTETVTVKIPAQGAGGCAALQTSIQSNPLTGMVTVSADPNAHVNTSDNVHVKISYTYVPAPTCISLTAATTDQDTGVPLTGVAVVAPHSLTKTTNPGTVSVDGLVVNNCTDAASKTFDIKVQMAQYWDTQPTNNPGNATFLYNQNGAVDTSAGSSFSLLGWGTGTPEGEVTCIQNVTLASNNSLLDRVHAQIDSGIGVSNLQNYNQSPQEFVFSVGIYTAGSGCTGTPLTIVGPSNPAITNLNYTVK